MRDKSEILRCYNNSINRIEKIKKISILYECSELDVLEALILNDAKLVAHNESEREYRERLVFKLLSRLEDKLQQIESKRRQLEKKSYSFEHAQNQKELEEAEFLFYKIFELMKALSVETP